MAALPEEMLYEGVSVDVAFGDPRPGFGDLYLICGCSHLRFPPSGSFGFDGLEDLHFDQVDDFFGVRSLTDDGDDVVIWLYPLVAGEPVHHHPGPFDGLRLDYNVLRNPAERADQFLRCVERFAALGKAVTYRSRGVELGRPPDLSVVRADIGAVVQHWAAVGIAVGSDEALEVEL
jgi:hypothetical protein